MLEKEDRKQFNLALQVLVSLIDSGANANTVAIRARVLVQSYTYTGSDVGELRHKLFRKKWLTEEFGTSYFPSRQEYLHADALVAAGAALVRLAKLAEAKHIPATYLAEARHFCWTYLDLNNIQVEAKRTEERIEWTSAKGPSQWARVFEVSTATMTEMLQGGKVRNKRLSSKNYMIAIDDLPASHQDEFRAK